MKKTLILSLLLLIPALLIGCTRVDNTTPTPTDQPTTVENNSTDNESIPPQVMAEKVSKYSRSWKMDKPELAEMNNFDEMLN